MTTCQATACSYCREKKLRCDRERPQCSCCARDKIKCEYTSPAKRVNHVKLLCDSVGDVVDRLSNVEVELTRLNNALKAASLQPRPVETQVELPEISTVEHTETPEQYPTDRHTIRDPGSLGDQYHGPCSAVSLCMRFRAKLLKEQQSSQDGAKEDNQISELTTNEQLRNRLDRLCAEVSLEPSSTNWDSDSSLFIKRPPKQFLSIVQAQFFQRRDYATDIFVQSTFLANVEQMYSGSLQQGYEPLALCCNAIILLVLGSTSCGQQSSEPLARSQFAQPFFDSVRAGIYNVRSLSSPRLINVQALILLSIVSQQYLQVDLASTLFAQACATACRMGLHQMHIVPEGISVDEIEERRKVFLSLYLQDKSTSISEGSPCWLRRSDCSLLPKVSEDGCNHKDRVRLAYLQESIYQETFASNTQPSPTSKPRTKISQLERSLRTWASDSKIATLSQNNPNNANLVLDYCSAMIALFGRSSQPSHSRKTVQCARVSCMVLLSAYGKGDSRLRSCLRHVCEPDENSSEQAALLAVAQEGDVPQNMGRDDQEMTLRPSCVMDSFSIPGVFALAENIVREHEAGHEDDYQLLKDVYGCFEEPINQKHARTRRLLLQLLEITGAIKYPDDTWAQRLVPQLSHSSTNFASTPEQAPLKTPSETNHARMNPFFTDGQPSIHSTNLWGLQNAAEMNDLDLRLMEFPDAIMSMSGSSFRPSSLSEVAQGSINGNAPFSFLDHSQPARQSTSRKRRRYPPSQDFCMDSGEELSPTDEFCFTIPSIAPPDTLTKRLDSFPYIAAHPC